MLTCDFARRPRGLPAGLRRRRPLAQQTEKGYWTVTPQSKSLHEHKKPPVSGFAMDVLSKYYAPHNGRLHETFPYQGGSW